MIANRGDVWLADLDLEPDDDLSIGQRHPVVVLSCGDAPRIRAMLVVAAADVDIRGIAAEISVGPDEGLPRAGVLRVALPQPGRILCDWLMTFASSRLIERLGALPPAKVRQLDDLLRLAQIDPVRWEH